MEERVYMQLQNKLFRDPIHGYIELHREELLPIVESREFQRLRRISHLGVSYFTYHGAEHSRFGHSLGTYHIFKRMLNRICEYGLKIHEGDKLAGIIAALLHDVGHGPFSHALEGVIVPGKDHEDWTEEIIIGDTEINQRLCEIDKMLPRRVVHILKNKGDSVLSSLISSQLDADRMDYLLRDSFFAGVSSGRIELDRIISMLMPIDESPFVAFDYRGQVAVEGYILARYFMYWQVYFHKTTRGFECLLRSLWEYASRSYKEGRLKEVPRSFIPFFQGEARLEDFLRIDNYDIICSMKEWMENEDPVLSDISSRLINRRPLKAIHLSEGADPLAIKDKVKTHMIKQGYSQPDEYILFDNPSNIAYTYYAAGGQETPPILIFNGSTLEEISNRSRPIKALERVKSRTTLYLPRECAEGLEL
jgi:HD superfamily phosphohydrolase